MCAFVIANAQAQLDLTAKPQNQPTGISTKGLSPEAAKMLINYKKGKSSPQEQSNLVSRDGKLYMPAIITLADNVTPDELEAYGVIVNSKTGAKITAMIPIEMLESLSRSERCRHIEINSVKPMLNTVREHLGIDRIHAGLDLPQGYDGSGVVVGIIDNGFKFNHPAFLSTDGTELRIRRVWLQADDSGIPPAGMNYGTELVTPQEILAKEWDSIIVDHGMLVSSIAAGCGAPEGVGAKYLGIAPGADIVLVSFANSSASIFDGIRYIHSYARSMSKPCVINISLGTNITPHDGTTEFDYLLKDYIQENSDSLAIVVAAGNEGDEQSHIKKIFTPDDTLLITKPNTSTVSDGMAAFYCANEFELGVALVRSNTGDQADFTGFIPASLDADSILDFTLTTLAGNRYRVSIIVTENDTNNLRYQAAVMFYSNATVPANHEVVIVIKCKESGVLHGWGSYLEIAESEVVPGSIGGDGFYTIDGMGACSDAVISVGSYSTKLAWEDYRGVIQTSKSPEEGNISVFSSLGPTSDERIKPDIAAPGETVISASTLNSVSISPYGDTINWNGQVEIYSGNSGTSMSAPVVAGIVALWMQRDATLGTSRIRELIHNYARHDSFTYETPNNVFGWGKVNAFAGFMPTTNEMHLLTATANPPIYGEVTGGGTLPEGQHTLTAIPRQSSIFDGWSDGVPEATRTVTLSSDTVFTALFHPEPSMNATLSANSRTSSYGMQRSPAGNSTATTTTNGVS